MLCFGLNNFDNSVVVIVVCSRLFVRKLAFSNSQLVVVVVVQTSTRIRHRIFMISPKYAEAAAAETLQVFPI